MNRERDRGQPGLSHLTWRKATRSNGTGGNCVEVAFLSRTSTADETDELPPGAQHKSSHENLIVVRDSKNPDGPKLYFTEAEWEAFRLGVQDGEFDDLR